MTRWDEELGTLRFCRRCDEWWPDDGEFWFYRRHEAGTTFVSLGRRYVRRAAVAFVVCRACQREMNRLCAVRRRSRRSGRLVANVDNERTFTVSLGISTTDRAYDVDGITAAAPIMEVSSQPHIGAVQ